MDEVDEALRPFPNLEAIVLGGSHARGTHREDSDLDLGLYYQPAAPFSIDARLASIEKIYVVFADLVGIAGGYYQPRYR